MMTLSWAELSRGTANPATSHSRYQILREKERGKERSRGITIVSEGEKFWLACLLVCGWETLFFSLRCTWILGCARADLTCFNIILMPCRPWRILFQALSCTYPMCPSITWHHGFWTCSYFLLLGWRLVILTSSESIKEPKECQVRWVFSRW